MPDQKVLCPRCGYLVRPEHFDHCKPKHVIKNDDDLNERLGDPDEASEFDDYSLLNRR